MNDEYLDQSGNARNGDTLDEDRRIDAYLLRYPVRTLNKAALAEKLKGEFKTEEAGRWFNLRWGLSGPGFATACVAVLTFLLLFQPLFTPDTLNIVNKKNPLSFIQNKRLQSGKSIQSREDLLLLLPDGSTLSCDPLTRLSVDFKDKRLITLYSGCIQVDAVHIEDSTMTVKTPLATIDVIGTQFFVFIKKKN